jgi:hypothetical protein
MRFRNSNVLIDAGAQLSALVLGRVGTRKARSLRLSRFRPQSGRPLHELSQRDLIRSLRMPLAACGDRFDPPEVGSSVT